MLTQINKNTHKMMGENIVLPDMLALNINTDNKGIVIAMVSLCLVNSNESMGKNTKEIENKKPHNPYIRNVPRNGL